METESGSSDSPGGDMASPTGAGAEAADRRPCASAPGRFGVKALLEKIDEPGHPRRDTLARRDKRNDVRPVEVPIRQDALQFAASDERRYVPFRSQRDTESGQRPIPDDLSVVAGERRGDTYRIRTPAPLMRLAAIAITPQCHVL